MKTSTFTLCTNISLLILILTADTVLSFPSRFKRVLGIVALEYNHTG